MAKRKLSFQQHCDLLQDVKSKKFIHLDLYKKYAVSKAAFGNYLRVKPERYRNYKDKNLVHSFFDKIDSEAKAYFLGLLFADGTIRKTTANQHYISLCSQIADLSTIQQLHRLLHSCTKIQTVRDDNTARCQFSSEHMYNKLAAYGMCPHTKFGRKIPGLIPKKYLHHFVRGLFDGDGCISYTTRERYPRIEFIASPFLLDTIIQAIGLHCSICKRGNISYIQYAANADVQKTFTYLYKNATIYLKRKYIKFNVLSKS